MIKVPANYSRCGIKVKCSKCKWNVKETCRLTGKGISTCKFKDKHKYLMVVHVNGTPKGKRSQITDTKDFLKVLIEYSKFKEELIKNNFRKEGFEKKVLNTSFQSLTEDYINSFSGAASHAHLNRKISKAYLKEVTSHLAIFGTLLKKKGYVLETLDLKDIGDDEVEILHNHLITKDISKSYYSKHFVVLKAFVNWVIDKKGYKVENAFKRHRLVFGNAQKNLISRKEFNKLIEVSTIENSTIIDKNGKKRWFFHPWLPAAFKLALETGLRREELFELRWNNIREIKLEDKTCLIIDINNLKVNRILFGKDTGKFMKPIPMTQSLFKVLGELGYNSKKGTIDFIIERDANYEMDYLKGELTRGFAHYIKKVTDRDIKFKDLRKTYITYLSLRLGNKAKMFTGHTDDKVMRDHYIAEEFMAANLDNFTLFDENFDKKSDDEKSDDENPDEKSD